MFAHIEAFPGDPILSLNEDFQRDPRTDKVNLSIGIYFDDEGRLPVMQAVAKAEAALLADMGPRPYLPMSGLVAYRNAVQALVFGENSPARAAGRIATLQTLGGSGALRVGADFLKRYYPQAQVWISDPSWENHRVVFERAGFTVNTYPYYDDATGGLKFDAMMDALRTIPAGSIVLLHACCHNPTGVDLNQDQWRQLIALLKANQLLPFVDMAYQGFGAGLEDDAFAIRELVAQDVPCLVANSFSKNFSLYGERCGGLSVFCNTAGEATNVLGQLTGAVRANYSNPPTHGARVVSKVLTTPELRQLWEEELAQMCGRIARMREAIHHNLRDHVSGEALSRYLTQRGMFTYTGLTADQAERLREQHGVYLLRSGRMCVAGLNERNVGIVAKAIGSVLKG
ncbi:Aspartate/aromatic aminotransferase [Cupriavidus necator]|uniref:Aspartate/tyrosine/aromatic aminotransferase n=1 Tax=Cupriavidus necator (strain ATCC 17699 / DSM 428 / KCTC 22496 / NCIMB 10442 / H16 / Stanier 337) TaxID=381666 RepID=Q0K2A2_CUPNH|nr:MULTISPECIES: amino acid aminotransferase [Cupriavidus]EON18348.1 aromatic amino acid aminotransferase [Cupriavidus sp. GA3-3]KUE89318.1 aromatic amino acid aminotransferase [Cupriavidus necator]QCC03750.1 aspartate/tyrosine/aromatic aminotransferase [Cupriavidus necator H16]QQB80807.1 aspartate/tyrosine/aromatic aminotransferase [Cupriavidus necator]WKA45106.1 amino acid aminotransferase [Cupriavidus necator]